MCYLFLAACGLSLVVVSEGSSLVAVPLLTVAASPLQSTDSRAEDFSSSSPGFSSLLCTGLVALWHVGSSQSRD